MALDTCRSLVYDDPHHLDGVRILGVDEHVWKHTRKPGQPSNLVTILVDLTPLMDERGLACLLDVRPGRSAQVLRSWLQERDPDVRQQVQGGDDGRVSTVTPAPSTKHCRTPARS